MALTIQACNANGLEPVYTSATVAGDSFNNSGSEVFIVKNGSASPLTLTVVSPTKCNQGFSHDLTITVDAGDEKILGKFAPSRFNDASGLLTVNYSAVTSVTVAVVRV